MALASILGLESVEKREHSSFEFTYDRSAVPK